MGFKARATMLILGIGIIVFPLLKLYIHNEYGMFYITEMGTFGYVLLGACIILLSLISRKAVRLPIKQIQIVYVDQNKNIKARGELLTEKDIEALLPVFNKHASPCLGIDEDEHIETALEITAKNKVMVYFLKDDPQYAKIGKYLFAIKISEHEADILYGIIKNKPPV